MGKPLSSTISLRPLRCCQSVQLRILEKERALAASANDTLARNADVFGDLPMIQSRSVSGKVWTR